MRSQIRQVLAFLRGDDSEEYIQELETILSGNECRFHIKLMLINQLGFEASPTVEEKELAERFIFPNPVLFPTFLESIKGTGWTNFMLEEQYAFFEQVIAQRNQSGIDEETKTYGNKIISQYCWLCRRQIATEDADKVLDFLDGLPEFEAKKEFITEAISRLDKIC